MTAKLQNMTLIGKLSITNWEAKKKAKGIEQEAERTATAKRGTVSARKSLLPGAEALEDIIKHSAAMRTWWNHVSAPWFDNGMRIYNVSGHLDIMTAYGDMARHRDTLVQAFISEYPSLREQARFDLNSLFDESEYPPAGTIASRFTCNFEVMPLPEATDFRIVEGLSDEDIHALQTMAVTNERMRLKDAVDTAVRRLYDAVTTMADRLTVYTAKEDSDDKSKKFYDSWITNVQEMADLMPQLNLLGDPQIDALAKEAHALVQAGAPAIKSSRGARTEAAARAAEISRQLSTLFAV